MEKPFDIEFEKAVRILAEYMPVSKKDSRKPLLFHCIRVGVYLYGKNYSRDIVLAGILHDALEFSDITEQMLQDEFGNAVAELVRSSTKNPLIEDPGERIDELIQRCAANGKDALIVKAADTIDSFQHYTKTNNQTELEYCKKNADNILKHVTNDVSDTIFDELRRWRKRS